MSRGTASRSFDETALCLFRFDLLMEFVFTRAVYGVSQRSMSAPVSAWPHRNEVDPCRAQRGGRGEPGEVVVVVGGVQLKIPTSDEWQRGTFT